MNAGPVPLNPSPDVVRDRLPEPGRSLPPAVVAAGEPSAANRGGLEGDFREGLFSDPAPWLLARSEGARVEAAR